MNYSREDIPLFSLSISHKQAPLEVRKLFAFTTEEQQQLLHRIRQTNGIDGAVLVSTCNRTEVYFSGRKEAVEILEHLLAQEKRTDVRMLRKYYRFYYGKKAMQHLFLVMSGLDSMVLGEDEILGQMREAYKTACQEECVDYYLNTVFQRALSCAKQIKTKTCLSKSSVSIATLSAGEVLHFKEGKKEVLLLGASGQMGSLIAKNLAGKKEVHICATARKHHPLPPLEGIEEIAYEDRYAYLEQADVIVSATASPHYTLTIEECEKALRTSRKRLFLDIAVPNDIDPDIGMLPGVVLKNIDYFQTVAENHNRQKQEGKEQAEEIIQNECEETAKELMFHSFLPDLEMLRQQFGEKSAEQFLYTMRDVADCKELEVLLDICRKLIAEKRV